MGAAPSLPDLGYDIATTGIVMRVLIDNVDEDITDDNGIVLVCDFIFNFCSSPLFYAPCMLFYLSLSFYFFHVIVLNCSGEKTGADFQGMDKGRLECHSLI